MGLLYDGITVAGTGAPVALSATPLWTTDAIITVTAAATLTGANGVLMASLTPGHPFQIPNTSDKKDHPHIDLSQLSVTIAGGQTAHVAFSVRRTILVSESLDPLTIADVRVSVEPEGLAGFADNATIDVWTNETGLGNDFVQVTEANKPICKTNILNGFRIARFDGVDDRISSQYGPKDDLASGFTFAAVFRTTTTATRQMILWTGDSNGDGWGGSFRQSCLAVTLDGVADQVGGTLGNGADPPGGANSYLSLTDTSNFHIAICTYAGFTTNPGNKTARMFLDGTLASADSESFTEDYTQYVALTRMGTPGNLASNFFNGDIAAAAIFARALSDAEILGLHQFWSNKFNL